MKEPRKSIAAAVGLALRAHRESTGKTRAQFVATPSWYKGWGSETLAAVETGRRLPTFERLADLAGGNNAYLIVESAAASLGIPVSTIRAVMSI